MDYMILSAGSSCSFELAKDELTQLVLSKIALGWEPSGGIEAKEDEHNYWTIAQAMIKR